MKQALRPFLGKGHTVATVIHEGEERQLGPRPETRQGPVLNMTPTSLVRTAQWVQSVCCYRIFFLFSKHCYFGLNPVIYVKADRWLRWCAVGFRELGAHPSCERCPPVRHPETMHLSGGRRARDGPGVGPPGGGAQAPRRVRVPPWSGFAVECRVDGVDHERPEPGCGTVRKSR